MDLSGVNMRHYIVHRPPHLYQEINEARAKLISPSRDSNCRRGSWLIILLNEEDLPLHEDGVLDLNQTDNGSDANQLIDQIINSS